jgi:hypothetical protein
MKSATRTTVSTLGAIMGLAGIEHGIGEALQGNRAPDGIMIQSWPGSEFFQTVRGEPAMTIIPNLLVTGILTVLVSLIFIVWATVFVHRKHGGLVLILLAIAMLLVGGGIFPPILGIVIGILGTRMPPQPTFWRTHARAGLPRFLGKAWPWFFVACVVAFLTMMPGPYILEHWFGVSDARLTYIHIGFALGTLLLSVISCRARDGATTGSAAHG